MTCKHEVVEDDRCAQCNIFIFKILHTSPWHKYWEDNKTKVGEYYQWKEMRMRGYV